MFELVRANRRRSLTLVVVMAALLLFCGYAVGTLLDPRAGPFGLVMALVLWVGLTLTSWFAGDRILLGIARARRIEKADHPVLWNVAEEMCVASGLAKMPALYIIDSAAPNAFATGRDVEHASVAVTAGLLEALDRDELQGVVAHELAHVNNRDVLYMTLVGVMLGAIVAIADVGTRVLWFGGGRRRTSSDSGHAGGALVAVVGLVLLVLAPLLARLMYLAISRQREYLADACAAIYTRYPEGLASALVKISGSTEPLDVATRATAPMYIVNPLKGAAARLASLGSTHPPTEERVRILRSMASEPLGFAAYDRAYRRVSGRAVGVVPAGARAMKDAGAPRREPRADARDHVARVREATDALWRTSGYAFVACACGTTLKVPPSLAGTRVGCPHCGREHEAGGGGTPAKRTAAPGGAAASKLQGDGDSVSPHR